VTPLRADLASLLEGRARDARDRPFLALTGGTRLTFGEFNERVNGVAHGLASRVRPGDRVACMLPNSLEFLLVSYALKKLGAVEVAVNTLFRGPGLVRMLNLSEAAVLVVDGAVIASIAEIEDALPFVRTAVVAGDPPDGAALVAEIVPFADIVSERTDDPVATGARDTDLMSVLFTSGTTGPAKGCMLSHRYAVRLATVLIDALDATRDDCFYSPFPLYHVDAAYLTVVPALVLGGRAAIGRRFSASGFWDETRELEATIFDFMGATLTMLWKQDPRPDDADNPVRIAWGVPMPSFREDFERRFGVRLVHCYGSTDGGMVAYESLHGREPPGSCGKPRPPFAVQIVDEHDDPVPAGEIGEIVIRPSEPDVVMKGYYGMPAETVEVFRNLWLHTGDLGRMDAEGHLYFVAREKDAIRRRGENISAWEIEDVVNRHPAVAESAAVGVPSELTEEEVKVFLVLKPGARVDPEELRAFCSRQMAPFMVPEHVQLVDEIPKTPTGKVEKYKLLEARTAGRRTGTVAG
jgi:crotonobetaine/carnitine-CoA ligase